MPNLKEVKKPNTLLELFRMDHDVHYLIKSPRGQWKVMKIKMDFRNSRFGITTDDGYNLQEMTQDSDINNRIAEMYIIDDLFDMIKDGK